MKRSYVWIFLVLMAVYIILAFSLPTDPQVLARYNIDQDRARLLNLTVVGPLSLIYFAALYGFVRVKEYAKSIQETKEGPHFNNVANGLAVLGFSLPINSIMSSMVSYTRHAHPELMAEISITRQYLTLVLAGIAIVLLDRGARGLLGTLKRIPKETLSNYKIILAVSLSSIYTWLLVTQSQDPAAELAHYLPIGILIATVAIPYVLIWYLGAGAAIRLYTYQINVKGVIYKRAVGLLAKGVAVIVLISVFLQFFYTIAGLLNRLNLSPLLAVIYFLIALYLIGYGLVARGAKTLKHMEEA